MQRRLCLGPCNSCLIALFDNGVQDGFDGAVDGNYLKAMQI